MHDQAVQVVVEVLLLTSLLHMGQQFAIAYKALLEF